jgi:DNA repair protein RadC
MKKKGLSFKDWPELNKPREKLIHYGSKELSVVELLAVILGTGTRDANVLDCAQEIFSHCGSLEKIGQLSIKQLREFKGLNQAKIARLKAALELGRRFLIEKKSTKQQISSAKDLVDFYIAQKGDLKQHSFSIVLLDGRNRILTEEEVFRGTLTEVTIHPREVFGRAVEERAAAVILVQNHPSGEVKPTHKDWQSFEHLREAGKILGIAVFDCVIIGKGKYYSLREKGII